MTEIKLLSISDKLSCRKGRSSSLAWVDFLTAPVESPSVSDVEDEDRRPSVILHDHFKDAEKEVETIDNQIFNAFCDKQGKILVGKFLAMLEKNGLKRTDYRLSELFINLRRILKEKELAHRGRLNDNFVGSVETLYLSREVFAEAILANVIVISTAFRDRFVIPKFDRFCAKVEDIYNECKDLEGGKIAPYLTKFDKLDPKCWGVSVCSTDGQRYSVGDTTTPLTLHSISKPLMYAYALKEIGKDEVHNFVGQEPSGHLFNELVLDLKQRPHNPMINAGCIMIHGLLQAFVRPGLSSADRFDMTHALFEKMSGGEYIGFNNGMFLSKREGSDRNWALAHYMKEYNCFPPGVDLTDCIEYYLQSSSLETSCEVLSIIAATLANGGVCPITGELVLNGDVVADVLSVLFSCGMSDFSGKFGFRVGLPAKSSILGVILLIVPNVCGMALWSPPLDNFSNSVRGVAFCEKLVETFNFHCFDTLRTEKIDPTRKVLETRGKNTIRLLFSAASGDLDSIFHLHLCGADMSLADYDQRTALHVAASEGHYQIVEYLLKQCGLNHQRKNRWDLTPYDEAIMFNQLKTAELLRTWHPERRIFSRHASCTEAEIQVQHQVTSPIQVELEEATSSDNYSSS